MPRAHRDLRKKERVSYTISDDSEADDTRSGPSSFSSPEKKRARHVIDLETDEEDELLEIPRPVTFIPRLSSAGHSLRQPRELSLSLKAQENQVRRVSKKRKLSRQPKKTAIQKLRLVSKASDGATNAQTARAEIRSNIFTTTTARRTTFFVEKKEYFLPLLPAQNKISLLAAEALRYKTSGGLITPTVAYEKLQVQPKGVKATMKPYQLGGLSFLVWLYRNGLSGILGDEMGLGKTLQTLSLIQWLKESRLLATDGGEQRPCLVVCPLSVLSSWMAECRKWTPELRVLRFHGPQVERDRMKRVALGEEDIYGNDTRSALLKKNKRLAAKGKVIIDLDPDDERSDEVPGFDLIVTTYETFTSEQAWLKRAFVWKYVVLDEGHKIKNDKSLISGALQGLGAEFRLILTGTPLQNNLAELWALLHWLYPEVFLDNTSDLFTRAFDLTRGSVSTKVMDDSRRLLELIMLRRMKHSPGVDLNLPPKTDILLFVPLTPMQRFWYTRLLNKADKGLLEELFTNAKEKEAKALKEETTTQKAWEQTEIAELEKLELEGKTAADWEESKEIMRLAIEQENLDEGKKSAFQKLMNLLMQLRKCCNHPYVLPHAAPDPYYLGEHVVRASGKLIVLDKLIEELVIRKKKKVLIFSGFTRMLDCTEDFLILRGGSGEKFKYMRLDGSTGRARRNLGIRMFNDKKSECQVMLISTRAGGLGVNLASASDVIILDQDWNPQIMLQAEARAHRIGQTQPVTVYKLCTQGTVEEQMMGRIQKKLYLSAKVTEAMRDIHGSTADPAKGRGRYSAANDEDAPKLDTSQLMSLVRRGAQALSHPEIDVDEMVRWDFSTMIDKCKDKPADIHVAESTQSNIVVSEEDEQKWLAQIEQVGTRVFEGKKYAKGKFTDDVPDEKTSRADRREGKNTTVMVDGFAISKESMNCAQWEAVPTMAGKDSRLAEPKRAKRGPIVNQEHCQICWDGGELHLCSSCPRSYHYDCLDQDFKVLARSHLQFHCSQHQCVDCGAKTQDAGGMIYRCRWCERGYCEDCLDFEKTLIIGENLIEYEVLGFQPIAGAFYIKCPDCHDHHVESPEAEAFCKRKAVDFEKEYEAMLEERKVRAEMEEEERRVRAEMEEEERRVRAELEAEERKAALAVPSRAESLTDATTLDDSGISTPQVENFDGATSSGKVKRKAAPMYLGLLPSPTKRSPRKDMHTMSFHQSLSQHSVIEDS